MSTYDTERKPRSLSAPSLPERERRMLRHALGNAMTTVTGYASLLADGDPLPLPAAMQAPLERLQGHARAISAAIHEITLVREDDPQNPNISRLRSKVDVPFAQRVTQSAHALLDEVGVLADLYAQRIGPDTWDEVCDALLAIENGGRDVLRIVDISAHGQPTASNVRTPKLRRRDTMPEGASEGWQRESTLPTQRLPAAPKRKAEAPRGYVLVVDALAESRETLRRWLRDGGYRVEGAADGDEAAQLSAMGDWDVVVVHAASPEADGSRLLDKVLRTMQRRGDHKRSQVLMLAAEAEDDAIASWVQAGADDVLTGLITRAELEARLATAVARKAYADAEHDRIARLLEGAERGHEVERGFGRGPATRRPSGVTPSPRRHPSVAVIACDIEDLSLHSERHAPEVVVAIVNELHRRFAQICAQLGVRRVRSSGGSTIAAVGLDGDTHDAALTALVCAQAFIEQAASIGAGLRARVGVSMGPVVSGRVGHEAPTFDVWGEPVETAQRLRDLASEAGEVWCCERVRAAAGGAAAVSFAGVVTPEGAGRLKIYRVLDTRAGVDAQVGADADADADADAGATPRRVGDAS
jgi:class 3 adenylate cyclase